MKHHVISEKFLIMVAGIRIPCTDIEIQKVKEALIQASHYNPCTILLNNLSDITTAKFLP